MEPEPGMRKRAKKQRNKAGLSPAFMGDFFSANRLSFPNFVSELSLTP